MWTSCGSQDKASTPNENERVEAASQEKNQYLEEIEARLRELDQEINALKAKAAKQGKEVRSQFDQQMAELYQKQEVARKEFEKLKNSSQGAWRDMKPGIDAAMRDLEAAYKRGAVISNRHEEGAIMDMIAFLCVGLMAGWLAGVITRGRGFGVIGDIIVGILGALVGGHILAWFGIFTYGMIGSIAAALVGAVVFLSLIRLVKRA